MPLTEKEKIKKKINDWKYQGLLMNTYWDYVTIYYHWLVSTHCEKCNLEFTEGNTRFKKCMDHNHNTGEYRNILCHVCNVNDNSNNTSGTPNISYCYTHNKWRYSIMINKKQHQKYFQLEVEAIEYKKQYESN